MLLLLATDWAKWTAFGTIALAAVTLLLVLTTLVVAKNAGEQIKIERRRIDEATKPHVFPAPVGAWGTDPKPQAWSEPGGWRDSLPVANGGPGVALNVKAELRWEGPDGLFVESVPTSLGPGESRNLILEWAHAPRDWSNVSGAIHYNDISGALWRTRFSISVRFDRHKIEVQETQMLKNANDVSRDLI